VLAGGRRLGGPRGGLGLPERRRGDPCRERLPEGTSSLTIEVEPENAQPDRPGAGELQVTVIAPDDEVRLHEAVPVHGQTLAREADPPLAGEEAVRTLPNGAALHLAWPVTVTAEGESEAAPGELVDGDG